MEFYGFKRQRKVGQRWELVDLPLRVLFAGRIKSPEEQGRLSSQEQERQWEPPELVQRQKASPVQTIQWWTGLPWWSNGYDSCLPIQGTRVPSLIQEDSTYHRATKPLPSRTYKPQLLKPMHLELALHNKRSHCSKKPAHHNWRVPCSTQPEEARVQQQRPSTAKNKLIS